MNIRIFEEAGGYHICDDDLDYMDARGRPYPTKAAATRGAIGEAADHGARSVRLTGSGVAMTVARVEARRFGLAVTFA